MPTPERGSPASRASALAAIVVALVAWLGLVLQFYVSAGLMRASGQGWLHIVVRYFSFFTVLTNLLVAVTVTLQLAAPASRAGGFFSLPTVRAAVAGYIALVGISYSLLLRHVWEPQGLAGVSDITQHDLVPILYVLHWACIEPKGSLRWSDLPRWLTYPALYLAFAMVQGAMTGFYPYHFIDAGKLGYFGAFAGTVQLLAAFLVIALLLLAMDRALGRLRARPGPPATG